MAIALDTIDPDILKSLVKKLTVAAKPKQPSPQHEKVITDKQLSSFSDNIVSLRNAFNGIYVYGKNIADVEKLEVKSAERITKESALESPSGLSSPASSTVGGIDLNELKNNLPKLLTTIKELTNNIPELGLESNTGMTAGAGAPADSMMPDIDGKNALGKPRSKLFSAKNMMIGGGIAAAAGGVAAYSAFSKNGAASPVPQPVEPDEPQITEQAEPAAPPTSAQVAKAFEPPKDAATQPKVDNNQARKTTEALTRQAKGVTEQAQAVSKPSGTQTGGQSAGFASKFASFLSGTFNNVTKYVASLPQVLASMGSAAFGALSDFGTGIIEGAQDIGEAVATGGKAADMEQAIDRAGIKDPVAKAQMMAQTAHESGGFKYTQELGNEKYFEKYNGRKDLGNTQPGDGPRFKGRGFLQTTGRANYAEASKALGVDFVSKPELLAQPKYAAASAILWFRKRLKRIPDWSNTKAVTKVVNGGYNGLDERQSYFQKYLKLYKGGGSVSAGAAGAVQSGREAASSAASAVGGAVSTFVGNVKDVAGNIAQYVNIASGAVMSGLNPNMIKRFKAMAAEYNQKTGKKLMITSAFRDSRKQAQLYAAFKAGRGAPAARPGSSKHEFGLALDVNSKAGDFERLNAMGLMQKYGFYRPIFERSGGKSEPWHVEPIETRKGGAPAADNPMKPGAPIVQADKTPTIGGAKPGGGAKPVNTPKAGAAAQTATNVAIARRTTPQGGMQTTVIAPQQRGAQAPSSKSYLNGMGQSSPKPKPRSTNAKSEYFRYFGIG